MSGASTVAATVASVSLFVMLALGVRSRARQNHARRRSGAGSPGGVPGSIPARLTRSRIVQRITRRGVRHPSCGDVLSLAQLLDDIARRCETGETLPSAFVEVARRSPARESFAPVVAAVGAGSTLRDALDLLPPTRAPEFTLTRHVLRLAAVLGGDVSESLDRTAVTLRERHAMTQERLVQSAQARLSARVLTWLPLGFAGWTMSTSPAVRRFVPTPVGVMCVCVGLALNIAGWRWMDRTIGAAT
jgi:hypothetical protein